MSRSGVVFGLIRSCFWSDPDLVVFALDRTCFWPWSRSGLVLSTYDGRGRDRHTGPTAYDGRRS
jgi:hypothetical protein|eukprot:3328198-Prymnesium_polylepis.1